MLRKNDTGGVHQTSTSGDNLNHSTKVEASETLHEQANAITALVETQAALVKTNAAMDRLYCAYKKRAYNEDSG